MSIFPHPGSWRPPEAGDLARDHSSLDVYTHVEGLASEEDRLLAIAERDRTEEHHARLREISRALDRAWAHLHDRAERRRRAG
jgi:hypothetical protein